MEELKKQMDERIGMALEITGWGLIAVGISLLLLKLLGVIHSPSELLINNFLTVGVVALLVEMRVRVGLLWSGFKNIEELKTRLEKLESKFELLWDEFKKRKSL